MNVAATSQVAEFLKVQKELVLEIREWASVLWVKVQGMRPRFVSKKIVKVEAIMDEDFYYNQAQSVAEKFKDANHIPLNGSDKQIAWAEVIRAKAIDSLAIQICNKEITEEQAWQTLNNKSAGWWIDNRGNWMDVKNTTYTKTSKKTTLNAWCWD